MSQAQQVRRLEQLNHLIGRSMAGGVLAFAVLFLGHLITDRCGAYHRQLCAELDQVLKPGRRLIGALPREHGKTTLGTVALVLHAVCHGHKQNILLIAANREEAQAKLRQIVGELESNELLRSAFAPRIAPARDAKGHMVAYGDTEIVLAGGAHVSTLGFGGKIRGQLSHGRRPDLVILDDPEDDSAVTSPEMRRKLRRWVDHALLNALDVKRGSLVWLGTLLHHDSVLAQWLAHQRGAEGWRSLKRRALDDKGLPLWPARWSSSLLERRRREIGERAFAQEFQNQPVSLEAQVFLDTDFRTYDPAALVRRDGEWSVAGQPLTIVIGVDPAIGEGRLHDFFAACVVGLGHRGAQSPAVYLLEMLRLRGRFAEQLRQLSLLARRYLPVRIGIESVAYQAALAQAALERGLPVCALGGTQPKTVRIEAAAVHVAQRRVWLPIVGSWVASFRSEAADYPAGRHDDQLDAFARALEAGLPLVQGGGDIVSAGPRRDVFGDTDYARWGTGPRGGF